MHALEFDIVASRGEFTLNAAARLPQGISVVYGPSGSGKSTLLHGLLGTLRPSRGRIVLGQRILFDFKQQIDVELRRRRIGMVFQDAPLFPHRDVAGNVRFGARGPEAAARCEELLDLVGLRRLRGRRTEGLSGGERQRVALARALAAEPEALLLDEPLSALDPPSRAELGVLLRELQQRAAIPFLHVTHDLGEAVRLADTLVVVDDGRIVRSGTPDDVLASPGSVEAARALGTDNVYRAVVRDVDEASACATVDIGGTSLVVGRIDDPVGSTVVVGVRAEDILVALRPVHETSARNVVAGRVERIERRGQVVDVHVATPARFVVRLTPAAERELGLESGRAVHLLIKAHAVQRLV